LLTRYARDSGQRIHWRWSLSQTSPPVRVEVVFPLTPALFLGEGASLYQGVTCNNLAITDSGGQSLDDFSRALGERQPYDQQYRPRESGSAARLPPLRLRRLRAWPFRRLRWRCEAAIRKPPLLRRRESGPATRRRVAGQSWRGSRGPPGRRQRLVEESFCSYFGRRLQFVSSCNGVNHFAAFRFPAGRSERTRAAIRPSISGVSGSCGSLARISCHSRHASPTSSRSKTRKLARNTSLALPYHPEWTRRSTERRSSTGNEMFIVTDGIRRLVRFAVIVTLALRPSILPLPQAQAGHRQN